jgi:hypothetical protein
MFRKRVNRRQKHDEREKESTEGKIMMRGGKRGNGMRCSKRKGKI